jgi:hypothetical protein
MSDEVQFDGAFIAMIAFASSALFELRIRTVRRSAFLL